MGEYRILLLLDKFEDAGLLDVIEEDCIATLALTDLRHL